MTILVTAASGQLGRLVLDALLVRGVEPGQIRAGARKPESLASYAERGVGVVHLDYDDATTAKNAVSGVDRVLLISGSEPGKRVAQHATVIDAAAGEGVELLAYTSAPYADTSTLVVAPEHAETEALITASGLPATFLRNNWYHENYVSALGPARDHGVLATSAGDGLVASAARADYAEAAAAVLTGTGHAGQVYELSGDVAWSQSDLAAALAEVVGREVAVQQLTTDEHVALLESVGLDSGTAAFVAAMDTGIAAGTLAAANDTLSTLIGRPTTPLVEGLRALA